MKRADIDFDSKTDDMKVYEVVKTHTWSAGPIFEDKVHEGFKDKSCMYTGERDVLLTEGDEFIVVFNKEHPRQKIVYSANLPSFSSTTETLALIPPEVLKEI
ncbi:MAG: hypothetical protein KBC17_00730 [Candidatus Pacebacteria bacterium]|nr:hypothetical protein [Candidatus Paceibacterota bacterium]